MNSWILLLCSIVALVVSKYSSGGGSVFAAAAAATTKAAFVGVKHVVPIIKSSPTTTTTSAAVFAFPPNYHDHHHDNIKDEFHPHLTWASPKRGTSTTTALRAVRKGKQIESSATTPSADTAASSLFAQLSSISITNPLPAVVWLVLIVFAFSRPDTSDFDTALIQKIIDNPTNPGINELFFTLFNVFLPLPFILASLIIPTEESTIDNENDNVSTATRISPTPFLLGSAFFGYFAIGPFLALRSPPSFSSQNVSSSWWMNNLWENKLFSWFIVGLLLYLPVATNLLNANDNVWNDFVTLLSSSRLASVSCADLACLHMTAVSLIPGDYQLRSRSNGGGDNSEQQLPLPFLAATLLLPFLGPALYVALRPSLQEDE